jgi:hypothetical protein
MAVERFQNFAQTELASPITSNSQTPITVTTVSKLSPTGLNYRIRVDDEIMIVTGVSGSDLSVTRGAEGTTATTHSTGALVSQVVTQEAMEAWQADGRLIDTWANLPTAGSEGRLFIATDGNTISRDNGSTWDHYGPIKTNLTVPIDGNFSWVNQGSSTVSTTRGAITLSTPAVNSYNIRARYLAKSSPYKVTAHFVPFMAGANYPACGIGFRSSASSKWFAIQLTNVSNIHYVNVFKGTNDTTWSSDVVAINGTDMGGQVNWFQIEDNGTTLYFRCSTNGKMWLTLASEARGTHFSGGSLPTGPAFFVNSYNATYPAAMHLLHWLEE